MRRDRELDPFVDHPLQKSRPERHAVAIGRDQVEQRVVFQFSADAVQPGTRYKLRPVIDASAFALLMMGVTGWLARRERRSLSI